VVEKGSGTGSGQPVGEPGRGLEQGYDGVKMAFGHRGARVCGQSSAPPAIGHARGGPQRPQHLFARPGRHRVSACSQDVAQAAQCLVDQRRHASALHDGGVEHLLGTVGAAAQPVRGVQGAARPAQTRRVHPDQRAEQQVGHPVRRRRLDTADDRQQVQ